MKIIHTSDWHLGQNFYGFDRRPDHEHMIGALTDLIISEKPDALIVAGDIYDTQTPGLAVQKMFVESMMALHKAHPAMAIVCISGNHDSASRHEIHQTPWSVLNVHMLGKIDSDSLQDNIVQIEDKGWIVAVPYTNDRFLDDEFYRKLQETVTENTDGLKPVIYVGHAAMKDCDFTGHDILNDRFIGGIECTDIIELGDTYDYIALGHIHKAQTFKSGRARYCGSPLPVGFDEVRRGYEHGFTIMEITAHGDMPQIRTKDLESIHPLVNIPAEGHAEWASVIDELKNFPPEIPAYIRLNVLLKDDQMLPYDKENQIMAALHGKQGRYAMLNPTREQTARTENHGGILKSMSMEELLKTSPLTVLQSYAEMEGFIFTENHVEMFNEVLESVNKAENEDQETGN
ncbi:MAG: exonuclease subunit SbcD [Bacteroidales bacterium]|nr:exonuclease subunit SbcD [Bacteroidales bacterium]